MKDISRRAFMARSACASLGLNGAVNALSQLQLVQGAAETTAVGADYKAVVCLFLNGGVDSNSFLIPIGGHPQRSQYEVHRGVLGVSESAINDAGTELHHPSETDRQYGMHPSCPNLTSMYNSGELGMVANVGTLAFPTEKTSYGQVILPVQLFSHSDQLMQWMSSVSDERYTSGWGGRAADILHESANQNSATSMMITAAGHNQYMMGSRDAIQYSVGTDGAVSLFGYGDGYDNAIAPEGGYLDSAEGRRLEAIEKIMKFSHSHILDRGFTHTVRRARENESIIASALIEADGLGIDFDELFTSFGADSGLGNELKVISRLIAGRGSLGNKRQVFFCELSGFDHHQDMNRELPKLLGELDSAVGAFNEAMKRLAQTDPLFSDDNVTLFTASDFNRTFTPNAEDSRAGTDHGWGGHMLVSGGAVNGGQVFGEIPDIEVGGDNDVPSATRGRWIPTTSVDQYSAVIAKWFGVAQSDMPRVFPNLYRFDDPFDGDLTNLEFLQA